MKQLFNSWRIKRLTKRLFLLNQQIELSTLVSKQNIDLLIFEMEQLKKEIYAKQN